MSRISHRGLSLVDGIGERTKIRNRPLASNHGDCQDAFVVRDGTLGGENILAFHFTDVDIHPETLPGKDRFLRERDGHRVSGNGRLPPVPAHVSDDETYIVLVRLISG